ncbi:hypothetical protein FHS10_002735 [Mucilaginibacter dorajii]|uniref:Uncharacterized protein n=1 Tax=Mucilaginibacter dorajii TaxID=692994 RepID=A0ABP7PCU0_9SPHI|nr:hypothetical protein [Mucilaginibacter dorajii]
MMPHTVFFTTQITVKHKKSRTKQSCKIYTLITFNKLINKSLNRYKKRVIKKPKSLFVTEMLSKTDENKMKCLVKI